MSETSEPRDEQRGDPTAPADPTTPAPPVAGPGPAPYPYGATTPLPTTPPAPPYPPPTPPAQPYGGSPALPPAPPPAYGTPSPYAPDPSVYTTHPGAYGAPPPSNGSAMALTIISAVSVAFCGGLLVIPALIFGIIALTKQANDPAESRRMTRMGWWAYAIGVVVSIVLVIGAILFFVVAAGTASTGYDGY